MKKLIKLFLASILLLCSTSMFAEGVDIVTLTTTAEGKTQDEAITNALRSAIEQAFGAFISSKTEIVNDELIRDEIVSVANGNVQKYDVLSSATIPNGNTVVSIRADVSVTKLTKFSESKGLNMEYKGNLFAATIKLQQLYEKNELKAIQNLKVIIDEMVSDCFNYDIYVDDPIKSNRYSNDDKWKISHVITISPNDNIKNLQTLLLNTLAGLSMNGTEQENYKKQQGVRDLPYVYVDPIGSIYQPNLGTPSNGGRMFFYLRNKDSFKELAAIFQIIYYKKLNCQVDNGIDKVYFKTERSAGGPKFVNETWDVNCSGQTDLGKCIIFKGYGSNNKMVELFTNSERRGRYYADLPSLSSRDGFSFSKDVLTYRIEYDAYFSLANIEKIQKIMVEPYTHE